jgi:DNA-binding transcriptional ArsR family regulator
MERGKASGAHKQGRGSPRKQDRRRLPEELIGQLSSNYEQGLDHVARRRILRAMHASGAEFSSAGLTRGPLNDFSLSTVSYHVKVLMRLKMIELTAERPVRGVVEHFFSSRVTADPGVLSILAQTEELDAPKGGNGESDVGTITLSASERDAIYAQIRADLLAIDDLRLALEQDERETADRLARRYMGELLLVVKGLGWGDQADGPVGLTIPPDELRPILIEQRDRAAELFNAQREDQEAFRAPWEQAALVRDTCSQALGRLSRS